MEELIPVNPKVIAFFVGKRRGKGLEEGLREIGIRSDEIERIKRGYISPNTLVTISKKLNIAMIRLMDLNEENLKPLMIKDFRRRRGEKKSKEKKRKRKEDLLDVIMETNDLVFLLKEEGVIGEMNLPRFSLEDETKKVAREIRNLLGLDLKIQTDEMKEFRDMIDFLREKLWERGVVVIVRDLPEEIDGISYEVYGVGVIIARKDPHIQRTIFTIGHELGHLLLGEHVYEDDLLEVPDEEERKWRIERWCNEFAAYFLLPEETNKEIEKVRGTKDQKKFLKKMMAKYKVSMSVLLYRLRKLGITGLEVGEIEEKKEERKGPRDLVRSTINSFGERTVAVVVDLYRKGRIDELRLKNLLGVGGKTIEKLEGTV